MPILDPVTESVVIGLVTIAYGIRVGTTLYGVHFGRYECRFHGGSVCFY
jgi:hypothetical protein